MTPRPDRAAGLSIRVKLTLSYAGFLLLAGLAMVVVGMLLLRFVPEGNLDLARGGWAPNRSDLLAVFVRYAGWAIGGLVVFGLVGGWVLSGWVLRPLARITDVARRAGGGALEARIRLSGRRDELTDLADTFDALLDRVQLTLDEERRFAANASHELRTPLAITRTLVEVAQADPEGRVDDVLLQRLGDTNDRAIALTEALLDLARIGRGGTLTRGAVDLAAIAAEAVADAAADAASAGVRVETDLLAAPVSADAVLVARLAANLVRNAIVHNHPGGWVRVRTSAAAETASLVVDNSGARLDPAVTATLTEPFVRAGGRVRDPDGREGTGLGLAIVAAVVTAHDGRLDVAARGDGGLQVAVALPR